MTATAQVRSAYSFPLPEPERPLLDETQLQSASTCGPKWLGGCYDYSAPKKTTWQVVKDPYFIWPTVVELGFFAWDVTVTQEGISNGCLERNNDLGERPSLGRTILIGGALEGATIGFRFVALKIVPQGKKSWIARGTAIGLSVISVGKHVHGINAWYQSGCL